MATELPGSMKIMTLAHPTGAMGLSERLSCLILMQTQRVLGPLSYRQGNKPTELKDLDQHHTTPN